MGIQVLWADEKRKTLIIRYEPTWTWDDFLASKVQIDTYLHSVNHTVHILSDSRASRGLPNGNALSVLSRSFQSAPDNIGTVVVLGANPLFKSLLQLLQTVSLNRAAKNIRFVRDESHARSVVNAV
jgi:hypothetical protein